MDRAWKYAGLAADVRRLYERLAEVSNALVELRQGELAAKCCDLELDLMQLHGQLIDRAREPVSPTTREDLSHRGDQLDIPF